MSDDPGREISEEELRALEAEIDRINVDDVVLQTIVSLINLGARKGAVGAPPEAGIEPDHEQLRIAIEAARALVAVVEPRHGDKLGPVKDALAQLQMAYARGTGGGGGGGGAQQPAPPEQPQQPPRQQGGSRLWVPGQ